MNSSSSFIFKIVSRVCRCKPNLFVLKTFGNLYRISISDTKQFESQLHAQNISFAVRYAEPTIHNVRCLYEGVLTCP
jgi:hypothetical protein